jgi:hypothetical protein
VSTKLDVYVFMHALFISFILFIVLDTTKEPTNIIMIAGVSGAVVAILIISIVAVCMCKHLRPK